MFLLPPSFDQVVPTIAKSPASAGHKSLSKAAAYQAIRRLVRRGTTGTRQVSAAIVKQFNGGGRGQTDLIKAYQTAGGDPEA